MKKLQPDEYMELLASRARERDEQVAVERAKQGLPPLKSWVRTLPSDMMRADDDAILDHAAFEAATASTTPKHTPQPRRYLPASHWADKLEKAETKLERLTASTEPPTTDMAAWGGQVSPRLLKQRGRRITEAKVRQIVEQQARVDALRDKLASAQRREAKYSVDTTTGEVLEEQA